MPPLGVWIIGAGAAGLLLAGVSVPWRYRELFDAIGKSEGIDPDLLHAIAWQESGINPAAIGPPNRNGTRDYGMMQINQTNFPGLGLTADSAMQAAPNVRAAARLLRSVRERHENRLTLADELSIYNAGQDRIGDPPRRDSSGAYINDEYVRNVLSRLAWIKLRKLFPVKAT